MVLRHHRMLSLGGLVRFNRILGTLVQDVILEDADVDR